MSTGNPTRQRRRRPWLHIQLDAIVLHEGKPPSSMNGEYVTIPSEVTRQDFDTSAAGKRRGSKMRNLGSASRERTRNFRIPMKDNEMAIGTDAKSYRCK
jgi:hypothetical protein